jgi:rubrerythrin
MDNRAASRCLVTDVVRKEGTVLDRGVAQSTRPLRLPRLIRGEWRCLDCGHLSYGSASAPRCPNCVSARMALTVPAGQQRTPSQLRTA